MSAVEKLKSCIILERFISPPEEKASPLNFYAKIGLSQKDIGIR